tara:strand:+ start:21428 stop:22075 length:648 start_codon:yes stop_codon:yes gene_type:complete
MELKKKSFILHVDSLDVLSDLSDEQAGKLFKAMLAFHKGEDIELDPLTKMAFSFFKNQFIRDNEKYIKTCEARAQAGSKGGKQKQQNIASASNSYQKEAKVAENDSDSDSDSKKDSKNKIDFTPLAFNSEEIKEFKEIRSRKKGSVTQRVINEHGKQFELSRKRGYTNDDILNEWSNRGWTAYKDEWMRVPVKKAAQQSNVPLADYDPLESLRNM